MRDFLSGLAYAIGYAALTLAAVVAVAVWVPR